MDSNNSKSDTEAQRETVRSGTDHKDLRKIRLNLLDESELSIAEDYDSGGDPYNTTGQHVIIKPKYTKLT